MGNLDYSQKPTWRYVHNLHMSLMYVCMCVCICMFVYVYIIWKIFLSGFCISFARYF